MAPTPQEALESLRTALSDADDTLSEAVGSITSDLQDAEGNVPTDGLDLSDVRVTGIDEIENAVDYEVSDAASDIASDVAQRVQMVVEEVVENALSDLGRNARLRCEDEIVVDEDSLPDLDLSYLESSLRTLHSNFEGQQNAMERRLSDIREALDGLDEALGSVGEGETIHLRKFNGQWLVLDPEVDHLTEAPVLGPNEQGLFKWEKGFTAQVRHTSGEWPILEVLEDHVKARIDGIEMDVRLEDLTRPSYVINGEVLQVGERVKGELATTGPCEGVLCGMEEKTPNDEDSRRFVIRREDTMQGGGGYVGPSGWVVDKLSLRRALEQ